LGVLHSWATHGWVSLCNPLSPARLATHTTSVGAGVIGFNLPPILFFCKL
jgi:hypothetical protein